MRIRKPVDVIDEPDDGVRELPVRRAAKPEKAPKRAPERTTGGIPMRKPQPVRV